MTYTVEYQRTNLETGQQTWIPIYVCGQLYTIPTKLEAKDLAIRFPFLTVRVLEVK